MSALARDYTIRFLADASQATAGFEAVKRELDQIKLAANGTANTINQVGQQLQMLPAAANVGTTAAQTGAEKTRHAFAGLNAELVATYAAFQSFQFVVEIFTDVANRIRNVREMMAEAGREAAEFREDNRELAFLQGKNAPGDEVPAGTAKFGVQAGMLPDQARKYLEEYEGSNPAGEQKDNVGPQGADPATVERVKREIAVEGARFGQRVNLNPGTAGDLAGVLTQYQRVESGQQAAGQLSRIAYGLSEGRGGIEDLTQAFINVAGATVDEGIGPIKDLDTLAGMVGIMSTHHGPREAATYLKKGIREVREFNGPQAAGLAEMGITRDMDATEAISRVHEYLKKQEAAGVAPDIALMDLGFNDKAGIQSLVELHRDWDILTKRRQAMAGMTGEKAQKANEEYFTRSMTGRNQRISAAEAASKYLFGQPQERVEMARQAAVSRMRNNGTLTGNDLIVTDKLIDTAGIKGLTGAPENIKERINREALNQLKASAEAVGLGDAYQKALERHGDITTNWLTGTSSWYVPYDKTDEMFNELAPQITARGGDPFGISDDATIARLDTIMGPGGKPGAKPHADPAMPQPPAGNPKAPLATPPPGIPFGGENNRGKAYTVSRVMDGDTIEVNVGGKPMKVRMVGVDTPETVHPTKGVQPGGVAASNYTKHELTGRQVYIRMNPAGDSQDMYGRTLGYVYRANTGQLYNKDLIEKGYGSAYTPFPFDKKDEFLEAEERAKAAKLGIHNTVTMPRPAGSGSGGRPASQPAAGQAPAPAQGVPVTSNGGGTGNLESLMTAVLDAIREQTDEMRHSNDGGPFGTHPNVGGGFTPKRA